VRRHSVLGEIQIIQTTKEELAREAKVWDEGTVTTKGWENAPDAVPRAKAATAISIRLPTAMLEVLKAYAQRSCFVTRRPSTSSYRSLPRGKRMSSSAVMREVWVVTVHLHYNGRPGRGSCQ